MDVVGRTSGEGGPTASLGHHRATDGSTGSPVGVDLNRPHAACVVGKRGSGKSYTLGVLAEGIAASDGVTAVVVDPMGAFEGLTDCGARVDATPTVAPGSVPPHAWCSLTDLDPASGAGSLVWRAAVERGADGLDAMREWVAGTDAAAPARRAARNHLDLVATWGVFDPGARPVADWLTSDPTVLDVSGLPRPAMNAVCLATASGLYEACVRGADGPLPWLLVDEAHAFVDGTAGRALDTVLTRGRTPGVSLVLATQRPAALPETAVSQSDLLVAHHLTGEREIAAANAARPSYHAGSFADTLPSEPGAALVVDDATETVRTVTVRERRTPHEGHEPRATERTNRPATPVTSGNH